MQVHVFGQRQKLMEEIGELRKRIKAGVGLPAGVRKQSSKPKSSADELAMLERKKVFFLLCFPA